MATAKKLNKSQKIRAYIVKHPTAKAKEIADAVNVTVDYVHQVVYKMKKEAARKTTTPTVVDEFTQTPKEIAELAYELTKGHRRHPITGKRLMQGAEPRKVIFTATSSKSIADIIAEHHTDMVNHPPHYKAGGMETIDFIEAKGLGYHLGNVVKYITRADHKGNKLEDLKKAQWYLNRAIEQARI
jgi:hypothetical protein